MDDEFNHECDICVHVRSHVLLHAGFAVIMAPSKSHIAPADGGHLLVMVPRYVNNRTQLTPCGASGYRLLSVVAGTTIMSYCDASMVNYQENGNWSQGQPSKNHIHMHIYGRSKIAQAQPFGESLTFPRRNQISAWNPGGFNQTELEELTRLLEMNAANARFDDFKTAITKITQ